MLTLALTPLGRNCWAHSSKYSFLKLPILLDNSICITDNSLLRSDRLCTFCKKTMLVRLSFVVVREKAACSAYSFITTGGILGTIPVCKCSHLSMLSVLRWSEYNGFTATLEQSFKNIYLFLFLLIVCVHALPVGICTWVQVPSKTRGIRSPRTGVIDGCQPPDGVNENWLGISGTSASALNH